MKIQSHWLVGNNIFKVRSPNIGDYFTPDTIVLHYTAGATAESSVSHLINPNTEVSAHLVVSRDLRIFQLVPFNKVAWHAGKSLWNGRESLNRYSIGIEIDNAGKLDLKEGKYYSWFGKEYLAEQVVCSTHKNSTDQDTKEYWHRYDDLQLDLVKDLCKLLISSYDISEIVGHDEISPNRKIDPGPALPIAAFKALVKS